MKVFTNSCIDRLDAIKSLSEDLKDLELKYSVVSSFMFYDTVAEAWSWAICYYE